MNSPERSPLSACLCIEQPDNATTVLTLNRPERRNALSVELMQRLCAAFEVLAVEPGRRLVLLRGNGPAFSSGLDLIESADVALAEQSADWVARLLDYVYRCPLITIAAAHGSALAGGAGLLAACDFVVAADSLQLGFPEVHRGLVPALVSRVLRHRLRDADLNALLLLGEPIDANRACELGLVHSAVPKEELWNEACRIAATVKKAAPEAVRQTKRLLIQARTASQNEFASLTLDAHRQARASSEAIEGLAAFLEKRPPHWACT